MTTGLQATSVPARRQNGHVSQICEDELDEISAFLRNSFGAGGNAPFAARDVLRWKYLTSAEAGLGDAAFTLGANGRIVAHAGLRSTTFRAPDGSTVKCGTIIDWAADRSAPGAGIALYRHLMGQTAATYLIGGTPTTQAVAERLGFRRTMHARVYARWVRPLDEFLKRPKTARSALRLLHGVAHVPLDKLAPTNGLRITSVSAFDDSVRDVLSAVSPTHAEAENPVARLNHALRNPMSTTRGHLFLRGDELVGCALSTLGTWNARILCVHGRFGSADDLAAAFSLVTADLAQNPSVCRVSVLSSVAAHREALVANAYWLNRSEPVSFYDPSGRVAALGNIGMQYLDADLDDYCDYSS